MSILLPKLRHSMHKVEFMSFRDKTNAAIKEVEEDVRASSSGIDKDYFGHRERYIRNLIRLQSLLPRGGKILDIGSHFLHQASCLSVLGYDVSGCDVPDFVELEFVKKRARKFGINNIGVSRLEEGNFLDGFSNSFDCVMFCEILEHITFNPIKFWKRVYKILVPGGIIYLTTPNGLRLYNILSTVKNAIFFRSIGTPISTILSEVTYGPHYKEYSLREILNYFKLMSPDFKCEITLFTLRPFDSTWYRSPKSALREVVRRIENRLPWLGEEIEAIVRVDSKKQWLAKTPDFG
jgi:2-polyprenyl-3-methyl-5-hydroxy-6-metoxy-1,4-benzoquinol methylase